MRLGATKCIVATAVWTEAIALVAPPPLQRFHHYYGVIRRNHGLR